MQPFNLLAYAFQECKTQRANNEKEPRILPMKNLIAKV